MRLEAGIAWRYLRRKKSHGAVSAIAVVSVVGVAVATAALICVLSVFNGFHRVLINQNDKILSDVEIMPSSGKVIPDADSLTTIISGVEGVELASPIIDDQALAICGQREMPVILRGVDPEAFRRYTMIDSLIISGTTLPRDAAEHYPPAGLLSIGVASRLQVADVGQPVFIFAPRREGRINLANPASSFYTDSIAPAGIFETLQSDYDATTIYVPADVARGLLQYDTEATSIAVKGADGTDASELAAKISDRIGMGYLVRDRARQQEMNFRMVEIEKWVTGLLLMFILVIASFNIISTMTMFVLEKRRQMQALRALGMGSRRIGAVFGWESLYITLIGGAGGILLGIQLCFLQARYGLIRMGGDAGAMMVQAYPVEFLWSDLRLVAAPILLIGLLTAWIASAFARSRISEKRQ